MNTQHFNKKQISFKKSLVQLALASTFSVTFIANANDLAEAVIAENNVTDETIVVTANRSVQNKFDVLAAVDVFDRESIEKIQPLSITDLLSRVAGVSATTQGTKAHQSALYVRGSNSNHILILVNGVRVGSATLGVKNLAAIPVQLIERVEIVRGPRAALWGSDAMGGVIQIFTRDFEQGDGQAGITTGSDNYWQGYGAIGFGNENHQYTFSATAEASDGYDIIVPDADNIYGIDQPDDDGFNKESIALNGTSTFTEIYSLEVDAQFDQGTTEIDASWGGDESDHENHHLLLRNHIQLDYAYLQLGLSKSKDSNEDNNDKLNPGQAASYFETKRDQVSALAQIPVAEDTEISVALEWYNEEISSSNNYAETKRNANSVSVIGRHKINQYSFEGSVRRDEIGDIDAEVTYQTAIGYQLSNNFLIALSHGTAFKAPSFNDLYYPFSGNENLKAETANNTEILTRYQGDNYSIELSFYQTDFDNLIEWAPLDPQDPFSPWQPENIASATIKGAEATINAEFYETITLFTISHIDAENDKTGNQLYRRPYVTANYSLTYPADNWDVTLDVNYQGHRLDTNMKTLNSATLFNLSASYEVTEQLTLLAKISNLSDKSYQQVSEYPGEERGYSLTLDYKF